jgi:predicted phage terminase large subunit-like protein
MTRWHKEDLVGRLLKQSKDDPTSDQWEVLHLPAIKDNQALWQDRYSLEDLKSIRSTVGGRAFESLYQGNPTIAEGNIIKREWWKYYRERPTFTRIIDSWDTAFKAKAENNYSVCTVWGEAANGYYLLDVWRQKVEYPELKRAAISLHGRDKANVVLVEDKASGQSLIQELKRDTKLPVLPVKVDSDKVSRVNAVSPLIESGKVLLPESAPWLHDYIEELSSFPSAEHDDQVDSTSQFLAWVALGKPQHDPLRIG